MPIRLLVIDDSVLFRTKLMLQLGADKDITIVGSAADAEEARKLIQTLQPDMLTLDVEMPKINGIDFLKELLPKKPLPVVVVSGTPMTVFDALDAGAVEFVRKPSSGNPKDVELFFEELKSKIKIAAKARVRPLPTAAPPSLASRLAVLSPMNHMVLAIGASTGGTEATIEVVKNLPTTTPGTVIVQHMPPHFTTLYAERLNRLCKMKVKEAVDFDRVVPGQMIIAAGDQHMTLKKDAQGYYIRSQEGERIHGHCPSVNALFESVAQTAGNNAVGVILTGMGSDGALGLQQMHNRGAFTIGQDKDSCVVYGMPMEAYKLGAVSRQLPLDRIGDELIYYFHRKQREGK